MMMHKYFENIMAPYDIYLFHHSEWWNMNMNTSILNVHVPSMTTELYFQRLIKEKTGLGVQIIEFMRVVIWFRKKERDVH